MSWQRILLGTLLRSASNLTLNVPAGSYVMTGFPPDMIRGASIFVPLGTYSLNGIVPYLPGQARVSNLNAVVFHRRTTGVGVSNLNAVIFYRRNAGVDVSNLNAVIFFRA